MRHHDKVLRRKRDAEQAGKEIRRRNGTFRRCPNCNQDIEDGGHFVPPSMGEKGFFICEPTNPKER